MTDMEIKLPFVFAEKMPSGNIRYRFQRNGKKKTIKGEPGTSEFLRNYESIRDGLDICDTPPKVVKGSVSWLVGLFLKDLESRVEAGLASPLTLKGHRHHLGRLVAEYGAKDCRMPRGKLVQFLDGYSKTPGARDNLRKSISSLYEWSLDREHIDPDTFQNPAKKIKRINKGSKGFYTCTIDDVRAYMKHHEEGSLARRVMIVELCTAARREDLRLLGRFNEFTRNGAKWLRWTQSKTPHRTVEIPMLPMLQEEVADVTDGVYCQTSRGTPLTHGTLGNYVRQWFDDAGARGSLHGVRKGLSSILPHLGATSYEIDVLLGHELGSDESKVYVEEAERTAIASNLGKKMSKLKW
jgi:integrase